MSKSFLSKNMCDAEAVTRFILGAVPISFLMLDNDSAAWIALLAVYPVITAIMAWDPLYAITNSLISIVKKIVNKPTQEAPSILPAN